MSRVVSIGRPRELIRIVAGRLPQLAVLAWAAFWAWFMLAVGLGEYWKDGDGRGLGFALVGLAILGTLVTTCWAWPRLGSVLLLGFGGFALWFFPGAFAVVLLALPPLALGGVIQAQSLSRGEKVQTVSASDRA